MSEVLPASYLAHRRFLYLRLALLLVVAASVGYWAYAPLGGRSGDTWLGYGLGGVAAALVLWLLWFGVRKRQYRSTGAKLSAWLSAHVYLGTTLLVLVPLHAAFEFGWNLHTLAFVLLAAVVVTGLAAVALYGALPERMTRARGGRSLESYFGEIADLDSQLRTLARTQSDHVAQAVAGAIDRTRIGGGLLRQLRGRAPDCATARAVREIGGAPEPQDAGERETRVRILELLTRKSALLQIVRRDVRRRALLNLLLVVHVPLATATLGALGAHVLAVFYYW